MDSLVPWTLAPVPSPGQRVPWQRPGTGLSLLMARPTAWVQPSPEGAPPETGSRGFDDRWRLPRDRIASRFPRRQRVASSEGAWCGSRKPL